MVTTNGDIGEGLKYSATATYPFFIELGGRIPTPAMSRPVEWATTSFDAAHFKE